MPDYNDPASLEFKSLEEFYPYYLHEHRARGSKILHLTGILCAPFFIAAAFATGHWWLIAVAVAWVYFLGWIGHFMIERNVPTTGRWPVYSFLSYFKMISQLVTGRLRI